VNRSDVAAAARRGRRGIDLIVLAAITLAIPQVLDQRMGKIMASASPSGSRIAARPADG
jgi:hypothetical protein